MNNNKRTYRIVGHLTGTRQAYFVARIERADGSLLAVHTNKNRKRLEKVCAIYS